MGFKYHSLATGHFQMPDGWLLSTIQKVAEVNEKAITKRNAPSHIHYIDIASVDKGKLLDIQELPFEKAPTRARRVVRDKDSLIATVRPNLEHYIFYGNDHLTHRRHGSPRCPDDSGPQPLSQSFRADVEGLQIDPLDKYSRMQGIMLLDTH